MTAHSQMTEDQERKKSELKQGLIYHPLRLQKRFPLASDRTGSYPSHTTTQVSCTFQLICVTVTQPAGPKIARYDLLPARTFLMDNSSTLLMPKKGLCKLGLCFTITCRVPLNHCHLPRSTVIKVLQTGFFLSCPSCTSPSS